MEKSQGRQNMYKKIHDGEKDRGKYKNEKKRTKGEEKSESEKEKRG